MSRDISTSTAFVTGANRGIGRAVAEELLARGARVYAGARNPADIDLDGAIPVRIDVTDLESVTAAAAAAADVDLLVNNAGTFVGGSLVDDDIDDLGGSLSAQFDVHVLGPLRVTHAFAPSLRERRGAVANVLSTLSWVTLAGLGPYTIAKSAEWALTNTLRLELAPAGVDVIALHAGAVDTRMTAGLDVPKMAPGDVAIGLVNGIASRAPEVVLDDLTRQVQAGLAGGVFALYPEITPAGTAGD